MSSGRALGSRYQLTDRLGEGAMGEVWRAYDRTTDSYRAAKLLKGTFAADREIVGRFVQERSILMGLDHPNIVKVHDLVVEGEDLAIVMDLVEGPDLRTRLQRTGTLTPRSAVTVTCAVLDALAAAHAQGCLHRDVKPDNVLLTRDDRLAADDVRLSDFSIARLAQESTVMSTGLLGTPGYMPPELFTEGRFSAASDLYAAGVLLYELLAGRTPFTGSGTAHTVGFRHVQMAPPPIPVAPELWHILTTMLAKDPRVRLSVTATATALRELPSSVLDAAPLVVQPTPDGWHEAVNTSRGSSPIKVQVADPGVDVGATNLNLPAPTGGFAPPVADAGRVQALAPQGLALTGETQLGTPMTAPVAPILEPKVRVQEERKRRWWPWAVGVVLLVGAVVAGLLVTGVIGSGDDDPVATQPTNEAAPATGPTAITAESEDSTAESGLGVRREATYDDREGVAEVTFTLTAQNVPLTGPFLQVFPLGEDGQCPLVSFTDGRAALVPVGTGRVGAPCAWELDGRLDRQERLEWSAEIPLELPSGQDADPSVALGEWLDAVGESTEAALETIAAGPDFAAQRITGLRVETSGVLFTGRLIQYAVFPEWSSGSQSTDPIFTGGVSSGTSPVISQVAGGPEGFDVRADCSGDQIDQSGFRLRARQQGSCTIEATLGLVVGETDVTIGGRDT